MRSAFVNALQKKSYEQFKALDDVSFEVKKGEFFGIIGHNGAGKSTLLKILANIYKPDSGSIKINGRIAPFLELGIGFNPELSGRDNIYLNATVLGLTKKEIDKKFNDIVEFSELEQFIDQQIKNYSSGMKSRLAFSVSVHANREILLMDEVLAVGDSNFQGKCLEEFNKYRELGRTVILVTHSIETVQRYCDRAMLLRNGRIEMVGISEEVGNKYIRQNISDEEDRLFEQEKKQKKLFVDKINNNKQKKEQKIQEIKQEKERAKKQVIEQAKEQEREQEKEQEKEQKKEQEKKQKKEKIAEILSVAFLDNKGKLKKVFQTGDDVLIRVYFKRNRLDKELNFGLTIHNQENYYLFGINTFIDNIEIQKCYDRGYFQINFNNIPFKTNWYFVKVGLFGQNASVNYDLLDKSEKFKVVSRSSSHGSIEVKYDWN
ncbi:MAG: ATP-binding cassette domain-containing protein [Weeksellaceae bacterium]|nr:ATP-binding cassette domain-containing protein [Weeksellaceae bacterium]